MQLQHLYSEDDLDSTFDLGSEGEESLHSVAEEAHNDNVNTSEHPSSDSDMEFSSDNGLSSEGEELWEVSDDSSDEDEVSEPDKNIYSIIFGVSLFSYIMLSPFRESHGYSIKVPWNIHNISSQALQ